jgi:26S proteasome regulatory subunit N10
MKSFLGGRSSVITAVQVASLALKHRKNKNGGQRIIVFIGSPVVEEVLLQYFKSFWWL